MAPLSAPAPWILVIGSSSYLTDKMRSTGERLGMSLARRHLNLASFGWSGVEEEAARAFIKETGLSGDDLHQRLVHFVSADHQPRVPTTYVDFARLTCPTQFFSDGKAHRTAARWRTSRLQPLEGLIEPIPPERALVAI